jgi:hypothetical protein
MVIGEPQKPLHLFFILRPWPVLYIFDISWPNVYSSRSHYSTQELYFFLKQFTFFGLLDANSAYWQVKIKPEDCSKTAFITKYGLFEFARMAFGPWPVLYIFDISWPNVYSSRSHYSTQELYFFLKQFTFFGLQF